MKFTKLEITNFLAIGHAELSLDDKGLVLLQGENKDDTSSVSNGAGKSIIPDALCWGLYGVTNRGESGDAVVHDKAKKDCRALVELIDGATRYRVARYRKHSTYKNELHLHTIDAAGAATELTRGTAAETQEAIEQILGCPIEVFKAAIYCGQKEMPDLPTMTDKALKMLIERAAGIERLERAYEIARMRMTAADRQHEKLAAVQTAQAKAIDDGEALTRILKSDMTKWEDDRAAGVALRAAALVVRKQEFTDLAAHVKATWDRSAIESKLTIARKGLESYNEVQASLAQVRNQLASAYRAQSSTESAARTLASKVKDLQGHIATPTGLNCPTCGREHDEARREAHMNGLKGQLEARAQEFKDAMAALDQRKGEVTKLQATVAELEAKPAPTELMSEIHACEAQLKEVDDQMGKLRRLVEDQKRGEAELAALKVQPNPIQVSYDRATHALAEAVKQFATTSAELEKALDDLELAKDCVKVFGPAGVRAHILDTVTPFLNERTADYLTTLSDGNIQATWTTLTRTKAGEVKEKFTIEVTYRGGRSFKLISGGQQQKVKLACILALQDLVASRATKPIDLWMGDEIDDALDSAGLERLMTLLETRARERGTVLIVSHNDLKDWIDNSTTVTLQGGISSVTGCLCV